MELLWFARDREADSNPSWKALKSVISLFTAKSDLPRWLTSAEVWPAFLHHSIYQESSYNAGRDSKQEKFLFTAISPLQGK